MAANNKTQTVLSDDNRRYYNAYYNTYSAAVTTLTDTACTYSGYSGPRGGVAA